ncbi:MAG: zinc-ribbon domain-containing protein [Chloroflexi bacterium]|nr:zinc-ribbon domain-containing protein [Chloroflexota bacterium]
MNCPNCGTSNPDNAAYCGRCGLALPAGQPAPSATSAQPSPADAIPPSTLGQLVNHTFGVYQRMGGTLLRIVLPSQLPLLAASVISSETLVLLLTLVGLFTSLLASAAVAHAVAQFYVGQRVTVAGSYVGALNNGVSLLLNALAFFAAVFGALLLSLMIVGIPVLVFIVVAWFFYVQAVVIEGKGPLEAIVQSWRLVRGMWWRTFGVGLAFLLLVIALGFLCSLPGLAMYSLADKTAGNFIMTLGSVLAVPVAYVSATLVYFDLRARKEGLTLSRLAVELGVAPSGQPSEGPGRPL